MLQVRDSRSGVGDAHSRAGVPSCPGVLACFCLSLDSFLLRLPQDHLCPPPQVVSSPTWSYSLERQKGAGGPNPLWRLPGGAQGMQSLAGQSMGYFPASRPMGRGTESQDCSAWSHLGQVVHLRNPISHPQGRGEARVGALSIQWAQGCGKGRRWGAGAVVPRERRIIFAAGSGI